MLRTYRATPRRIGAAASTDEVIGQDGSHSEGMDQGQTMAHRARTKGHVTRMSTTVYRCRQDRMSTTVYRYRQDRMSTTVYSGRPEEAGDWRAMNGYKKTGLPPYR